MPQPIVPVWAGHKRRAAATAAAWPVSPRSARRAGARQFWRNHKRPAANWCQFWQTVNATNGVVHY